jgi:phosphopantothenoylcysteine decarboxylase / phosphopantothenate---cysteine ligase
LISFKYQENISHEQFISIAQDRLSKGDIAIVANRGEETGANGAQIAWLVTSGAEPLRMEGKKGISAGIANFLERLCDGGWTG